MHDHWQRLKDLAADALELPPPERLPFLQRACHGETGLLEAAVAMVQADAAAGDFLMACPPMPASVQPLAPGTEIGAYRIEAMLGEGGSSEVYRARQRQPIVRDVALKLLKPGMDSRALLARFASERDTLARLDHPHIARVLDAGALPNGRPWVVAELVDGLPLRRFADAEDLGLQQRLQLFLQVCAAVAHAHRRGVVHRDLKPGNVLVERHDGVPRAKVIDFGIAKLLEPRGGDGPLTTTGMVLGTPAYASPEQLDDKNDVDTRTDVWALGVLLYELLTGSRPTDGRDGKEPSLAELVRRVRDEAIEPPSRRRQRRDGVQLPVELDWITGRALAVDRERRYPTVDALADDLRRYLAGEALTVGPPTVRYRLATLARRHRSLLAAAALAFVALTAGSVATTIGWLRAGEARDAASAAAAEADRARNEAERLASEQASARQAAEAALAEATAVSDFLAELLAAARPTRAGREVRVVDLLAQANVLFARVEPFPAAAVRLRRIVGDSHVALGDFPAAEVHQQEALRLARERFGADDWRTIDASVAMVALRSRQGRYAEAEPLLDGLAQRAAAARGPDHPLARTLCDLRAKVAFERGHHAEAAAALRELARLDEADGNLAGALTTLSNLSQVLLAGGLRDEALATAKDACERAVATLGPEHPVSIAAARKLAAVHIRDRDYAALVAAVEPLVESARKVLGESHPDTLGIENYLALGYQNLGRTDDAERIYRRLLAEHQGRLGADHPQTLMVKNNLGTLLESRGDLAGAETVLREAATGFRRLRGDDHVDVWSSEYYLARVVSRLGRPDEVATMFAAAVAGLRRHLGEAHPKTRDARGAFAAHLRELAQQRELAGDGVGAMEVWQQAFTLCSELNDAVGRRAAATALAESCAAAGDAAGAAQWRAAAQ